MKQTRRKYLSILATGIGVQTAGCSTINNKSTPTQDRDASSQKNNKNPELNSDLSKHIVGIGNYRSNTPDATGWLYENNNNTYIITNDHALEGNNRAYIWTKTDGWIGTEVVGSTAHFDIAALSYNGSIDKTPLEVKNPPKPNMGSKVYTIGFPSGKTKVMAHGKITSINEVGMSPTGQLIPNGIETSAFQTDGSSGSPIITTSNKLIGMIQSGEPWSAYGIGAEPIKRVLDEILAHGVFKIPFIGIFVDQTDRETAEQAGYTESPSVKVTDLQNNSPAANLLISGSETQHPDVITRINGNKIRTKNDFWEEITLNTTTNNIEIMVARSGQKKKITIPTERIS